MRQQGLRKPVDFDFSALTEDTVAYALWGSHLYGIDTPQSDLDVYVITRTKKKATQIITGTEDVSVVSLSDFLTRFQNSAVPEMCIVQSGGIQVVDENYRAVFESLRFDSLRAYANARTYSMAHLHYLLKAGRTEKRANKTIRTIARNQILSEKILAERLAFNPVLTNAEKARYDDLVLELDSRYRSGSSKEDLAEFLNLELAELAPTSPPSHK